jgi:3-oxoadipate enol-lactonase
MPLLTIEPRGKQGPLVLNHEIWGGAPADGTVLLLHELGGTLQSLAELGRALATRRPVVAFDQRGAGLSEKPPAPWTLADLADDVEGLLSALGVRGRIHLVGTAMGAVTALHFAMRHGPRLASLVLVDGTSEITASAREYILARAERVRREGMRPVLDQSFANAFRGIPGAAERWAWYRDRFLTHAPESYASHSEALAAMALEKGDLDRVSCPTLVLTGEHDFIWPPSTGRALAALLPRATFAVAEGAAHFPAIQDVAGTAATVSAFLDRVGAGRQGA